MKVFCLAPNENWVCDRFVYEWTKLNQDLHTSQPDQADVIWLLADWCWQRIPKDVLKDKIVVCTVHHLVPEKFDKQKLQAFIERDQYVDVYHVPSQKTYEQVSKLTNKKIFCQPFWINQLIWKKIDDKISLRKKHNLPLDAYVVGSFQRDTEGNDLRTPKLEKGPDIFVKYVEKLIENNKKVHVMLAGWRRQYVVSELDKRKISYTYKELPDFQTLNELYNCLDLYVVGSRYEGGPQSIFECAAIGTPIVSSDVGIVSTILDRESIFNLEDIKLATPKPDVAFNNVQKYLLPQGIIEFRNLLEVVITDRS